MMRASNTAHAKAGRSLTSVSAHEQDPTFFDVAGANHVLDFWAFGLILALSVLLCWGIKETKTFNNGEAFSRPRPRENTQHSL